MNFSIRPFTIEHDLPAFHSIYAEAVLNGTGSFELEPPTLDDLQDRAASLLRENYPFLVADDEEAQMILGFAYGGPHKLRPAYRFTVESSIYVAPQAKKRGVGAALLSSLIDRSTALGFRQMVAVVGDSANTGSILVHAKYGFEEVGRWDSVGFKHGKWRDVVLMQRPLGEGSSTSPE